MILVNGVQVSGFGFFPIVGQKALLVCLQGWCGWQTFQWTAPALQQDRCAGKVKQAIKAASAKNDRVYCSRIQLTPCSLL